MSDTIKVNGVAFDLTGKTVKFKMRAEGSSTLKVNAAATIVNPPGVNGAVVYDYAAVDVDTVGRWLFWWEVTIAVGITQDTPESLITILDHAPGSRALCTLEDIQAYTPGYIPYSDLTTDSILLEMIEAVSTEIHNDTGREFQPVVANPSAKVFDLSAFDASERRLYVGDLVNLTGLTVSIASTDGVVIDTIAAPDFGVVGLPRNRQQWQPFNYLSFPVGLASSASLAEGSVVTVTGNWGFQQIPGDIRLACIKLVINRYLRDVASGGTAFSDALTDGDFDLSTAFASAMKTIDDYTFYTIA